MAAQATEPFYAYQKASQSASRQAFAPKKAAPNRRQKGGKPKQSEAACFMVSLILITCALLHWAPVYGATLQLDVHDNLLSLSAEDSDLSSILQRISEATGIDFRFPIDLQKKITLKISDVRLETALKRILKGLNYATVYSVAGSGDPARISTVYIYGKQKGGTRTTRNSQPSVGEGPGQHRISDYERRIQVVQRRLDRVAPDSPAGRRYRKEIENYQRLIERLKRLK